MKIKIYPSNPEGTITAPPSKSNAHRLLICAGLADGESEIYGIEESEDVSATIDCLCKMGAEISVNQGTAKIKGISPFKSCGGITLQCRESGSTLRFFIPLNLLGGKNVIFTGSETLLSRPMGVYEDICKEKGLVFSRDISSIAVKGPLPSGNYKVCGNVSSQFISGLLFALPLTKSDSTITITQPIESLSYINLTIAALKKFGVYAEWQDERTIFIKGSQKYSPLNTKVDGDYSNAAFYDSLNLLSGKVSVTGLDENSLQGDRVYKKMFDSIQKGMPVLHISDCPDLGPILFAVASSKFGAVFTGTKRLKIKECDRSFAMSEELKKFGVSVNVRDDSVVVLPKSFHAPNSELFGYNDHRIVMALACLCTKTGGIINGAEAVNKSNPHFFEHLNKLGVKTKVL